VLQSYGESDFITLIYELENYNVLVEYLYKSWNRSAGTGAWSTL